MPFRAVVPLGGPEWDVHVFPTARGGWASRWVWRTRGGGVEVVGFGLTPGEAFDSGADKVRRECGPARPNRKPGSP